MRTNFFMPAQASFYNNKNRLSFKGIEAEFLRKIAAGKINDHILSTLVEGHLREAITPELQAAFDAAYRTGRVRRDLNAYLERKPGLTKPE